VITFNSETSFTLKNQNKLVKWIGDVISSEGFQVGEINYIFCDDSYLNKINQEFLNHDTFTDIISFDYTLGKEVGGDIFISIERVLENAENFNEVFETELYRVMIHGILHFMGYKDKTKKEKTLMRTKEDENIFMLKR
jgi:rRNA maturation RNase YbeY